MSFGRSYASILLIVFAVFAGGAGVRGQSPSVPAQPSNGGVGVIVPVTGVADVGGLFSGALLIQSFAAQGNSIVTTGVVTGALMGNGTFRNLVLQVTLPRLNRVAFDIASTSQTTSPATASSPSNASALLGTVTSSPSANATQPSLNQQARPAAAATTPLAAATTAAASQTPLASQLCSVNGFRDASNPVQLAQQLNAILAALAGRQG